MILQAQSMKLNTVTGDFLILDQTLLPHREDWIEVKSTDHMVSIIKEMKLRGAPAIGISAGLCLAFKSYKKLKPLNPSDSSDLNQLDIYQSFKSEALKLRNTRPTAVNLSFVIDELLKCAQENLESDYFRLEQLLQKKAISFFEEDKLLCERMSQLGASFIDSGDSILHHCNTGGLATAGDGTALGAIKKAHLDGKKVHVFVSETRPLLQGARLTCYELKKWGISHTLITDSMAAQLMQEKKIDKVFVGADRVASNGDFANKIGTYSHAIVANFHKIPVFCVAPYTTIDEKLSCGADITIEQRSSTEVTGFKASWGEIQWSPTETKTYNPAFDVTPSSLYTALITDRKAYFMSDFKGF